MTGIFEIGQTKFTEGTRRERGTGLGLILRKGSVEKHNGKIWVESEERKSFIPFFE